MLMWLTALLTLLTVNIGAPGSTGSGVWINDVDESLSGSVNPLPQSLGGRSPRSLMYHPYTDHGEYRHAICSEWAEDVVREFSGTPINLWSIAETDVWNQLERLVAPPLDTTSIQRVWIEQFRVVEFVRRSSAIAWPYGTYIVEVSEFALFPESPLEWQITFADGLSVC